MMEAQAVVEHQLPGRARFRISSKRGDAGYFKSVVEKFAGHSSVEEAYANPRTGSLLVVYSPSGEPLDKLVDEVGLFKVESGQPRSSQLVAGTPAATNGSSDTFAAGLAGLGAVQAVRGRVLGSATDEFWRAYAAYGVMGQPLLAWAFLFSGAYQLIRGELFSSASALIFYALTVQQLAQSEGQTRPQH